MKLGSNDISAVKIGSTDVNKIYIGSTEVWSSFTGLLDTYTGAAAAYSLRQLKSGVTNAIEVRIDTTGQPTYDIGFVDGELDVTTLEGYCTGGLDAYVTTWYDQSGNGNDATQSTDADQPQIVSSGSVITENGKPAVQFDGSDDAIHASYSGISGEDIPYSNFNVIKNNASSGNPTVLSLNNSTDIQPVTTSILLGNEYGYYFRSGSSAKSSTSAQSHVQTNYNLICEGTTTSVYYNGSQIINSGDTDLNAIVRDTISIGTFRINTPANYFLGNIQEIILYPSDESSNRSGIETNINDFYSIYYVATNSEYQDVLDYADSQGYQRPSYAQQALQDALVGDLKDAGVWSKLDTFYVFATDGDREYAAINWKDPNSFEITEVNSPTFTTDVGFTGNGSSAYLDPSYNQGTDGVNWSNPNGSYGVYVHTAASSDGMAYAGETAYTYMRRGTRKRLNGLDANNKAHGLGFHLLTRNSTNFEYCFDGIVRVTLSLTTWSNASDIMFLGQSLYSDGTISIGFFGGDLSSEQGDFYTAVDSYMTSI